MCDSFSETDVTYVVPISRFFVKVRACFLMIMIRIIQSLKFIKVIKVWEIFTLLLTDTTQNKSKVEILQNFVAFSEYMNFTKNQHSNRD